MATVSQLSDSKWISWETISLCEKNCGNGNQHLTSEAGIIQDAATEKSKCINNPESTANAGSYFCKQMGWW